RQNTLRSSHGNRNRSTAAIEHRVNRLVVQSVLIDRSFQRRKNNSFRIGWPVTPLRQFRRALLHMLAKPLGLNYLIHQSPVLGTLPANSIGSSAKNVREVSAHSAFVGHPRQSASSRQHA